MLSGDAAKNTCKHVLRFFLLVHNYANCNTDTMHDVLYKMRKKLSRH